MSVFNGSRHLRQSIDSILGQTCRDFEFIIVNDGSGDDTTGILRGYTDPRVTLIDHEQNKGLTCSLIEAIGASLGEFIARQDSDDLSDRERLDAQLDYLRSHPDVAAVGSWANQIDDDGDCIALLTRQSEPDEIRSGLPLENQFHHGSVMFRRRALEHSGGYRAPFRYAQDYDLFLRLSQEFGLANLTRPLYSKRHTPDAVSIVHAGEQKAFADLALELHRQRLESGTDDLENGKGVDGLLNLNEEKQGNYVKNLVYLYLRSDKCKKARPYILKDIRTSPYNLKSYLQYGLTFLNRRSRNRLFSMWD
jgi:glycosyltransferase involved in cell wall biosynthesis